MSVVRPTRFTFGFLLLQYSVVYTVLLSPYLYFVSFLYLDLYLLGYDTSISKESLVQTKHLFVLTSEIRVRLVP